jgi:hypothetical protein
MQYFRRSGRSFNITFLSEYQIAEEKRVQAAMSDVSAAE